MDGPRRDHMRSIQQQRRPQWNSDTKRPPLAVPDPMYGWWPPAQPKSGDSLEQGRLRLASAHALNLVPRDPRYYQPELEARWVPSTPLNARYIPDYDVAAGGENVDCIGQIEPFISRPANKPRADHVAHRLSLGRRTSPLISYNSLGWNRRHYEPVPDVSRNAPKRPYFDGTMTRDGMGASMGSMGRPASRALSHGPDVSPGSPIPPLSPNEREAAFLEGYASSPMGSRAGSRSSGPEAYDPPRIEGVDTHSRPPLLIHSTTKVRRSAWIGTRY